MSARIGSIKVKLILTLFFLALGFIFVQRRGHEVLATIVDSGYQYGGCITTGDPWCSAAFPRTNVVWNSSSFPAHGQTFNLGSTINATGQYTASHTINNTVTPAYDIADSYTVWLQRDAGGCQQILYVAPMAVYSNSSAPSGSVTSLAGGTFTIPSAIDLAMCGTSWRINLSAQNKPSPNANDTIGAHAIGEHITLGGGPTPTPPPGPTPTPPPGPTPGGPTPTPAGVINLTITDNLPERIIGSNDSTVYNFTVGGSCATPHTLNGNVIRGAARLPEPTVTVNLSTTSVVSGDSGTAEVITNSTPADTNYRLVLSISRGVCGQDLKAANFDVVAAPASPTPPPPSPSPTPTPPPPPPPPPTWPADANLQAATSCVAGQPQIAFSWNDATGEDRYYLDVNGAAWTGLGSPSPWGVKSRLANQTTFTWSPSSFLDSGDVDPVTAGDQRTPVNNKTYWWRVFAENSGGGLHRYPRNSATWPGISLTTPNCVAPEVDLKARFVNDPTSPSPVGPYDPNEPVTIKVRVTNIGTLASDPTTVGFWPTGSSISCPDPAPPPPVNSESVSGLAAGGSVDVEVTFNTPSLAGSYTANAFVIPNCNNSGNPNLADVYWPNNKTDGPVKVGDSDACCVLPAGFTYLVRSPAAWFETIGGDVGARNGAISVSQTPIPAGRYQSGYLAVATGDLSNIVTRGGWRIKNYTGGLVPSGGIYTYMAERFRQKAIVEGHDASHPSGTCRIKAGAIPNNKKFAYCSGDAEFDVGNGPEGEQVWFIDGNLTIKRDLELAGTDTITFIVKGNINIEPTVTRIDGIYVAGGTFDSGNVVGQQLVIVGGVYAGQLSLGRVLSASGCGVSPCDNAQHPAEIVIYDPKYIIGLSSILGSPSYVWREVAP